MQHRRVQVLDALKMDLSLRADNTHAGSGLGGNPSQLFFLLSRENNVDISEDEEFHIIESHNKITFQMPRAVTKDDYQPYKDMKVIRQKLTEVYNKSSHQKEVTFQQLVNPSWLKDQGINTIEIKLLIKALTDAYTVTKVLDAKGPVLDAIFNMFEAEKDVVARAFLKDMGISEDHFQVEEVRQQERNSKLREETIAKIKASKELDDQLKSVMYEEAFDIEDERDHMVYTLRSTMESHPVFGATLKAASKRHNKMFNALLSATDLDQLNAINNMPHFIAMLAFRVVIQLERMVKFNIDERIPLQKHSNTVDGK